MPPDQTLLSQTGPSPGDGLQPLAALGPSLGFWIYGLPGSRLGLRRSAGAPALESLARGAHDGENWRAWIFYGPPDQALAELADQGSSPEPEGGALLAWQQTMELAVQVRYRSAPEPAR